MHNDIPPLFPVSIYHNPTCSNSRGALALIRERGLSLRVIEYLKTPISRDALAQLLADMDLPVRGLLRSKEAVYSELGLADTSLSGGQLLDAMVRHPVLMNRPIVVTPLGTRLCRPPETVLQILPPV